MSEPLQSPNPLITVDVTWYDLHAILLCTIKDPVTRDQLEHGLHQLQDMAKSAEDVVDLIFDYRALTVMPQGMMSLVQSNGFTIPTLDRVALVGTDEMFELMMSTITRSTFRPDPTVHATVDEAAKFLRKMAKENHSRL